MSVVLGGILKGYDADGSDRRVARVEGVYRRSTVAEVADCTVIQAG
jgi:hypothetical protein